ncbi:MAG: TrmB family transcriptional regulator [Candidatus Heimdallarchaeota archaeon]
MSDDEILELLQRIDLTLNQAKVYLALVRHHEAPASQLCEDTQIKDSKIYSLLKKLENLGLIVSQGGNPKIYRALVLEEGMENIRRRVEQGYLIKTKAIKELKLLLTPIFDAITHAEIALVVKGEGNIFSQLRKKMSVTINEVTTVAPGITQFEKIEDMLQEAHDRGVKVKAGISGQDFANLKRKFPFEVLPMACETFHVIFDNQFLINISEWDDPELYYAIVTTDSNLISVIKSYIDTCRLPSD